LLFPSDAPPKHSTKQEWQPLFRRLLKKHADALDTHSPKRPSKRGGATDRTVSLFISLQWYRHFVSLSSSRRAQSQGFEASEPINTRTTLSVPKGPPFDLLLGPPNHVASNTISRAGAGYARLEVEKRTLEALGHTWSEGYWSGALGARSARRVHTKLKKLRVAIESVACYLFRSIVRLNRGENRTLFAWRISASAFYLFARSCKSPESKRRPASTAQCSKNWSPAGFSQRIAPWCSTDRLGPSSSARTAPSMMKTDATMAARRVEASSLTSEMLSRPKTAYT